MGWMDDAVEEVAEMKRRAKKDLSWEDAIEEDDSDAKNE